MVMAKKIVFEIIADSDSTTPVSYTHLDVYKRQKKFSELLTIQQPFFVLILNRHNLKANKFI